MKPATPLPWTRDYGKSPCINSVGGDLMRPLAQVKAMGHDAQQNISYIVHACNAYPKLVEALRKYLSTADYPLAMSTLADVDADTRVLLNSLGELGEL